jgi:periplasmic protein TonB
MSLIPSIANQQSKSENRRAHARRKFERLTYVKFGQANGGILLNLSEEGLSFQAVGTVDRDEPIALSFKLPGATNTIEAIGQVVWCNESGKGGGLQFLELSAAAREQIKKWVEEEIPAVHSPSVQRPMNPLIVGELKNSAPELPPASPVSLAAAGPPIALTIPKLAPSPPANIPIPSAPPPMESVPAVGPPIALTTPKLAPSLPPNIPIPSIQPQSQAVPAAGPPIALTTPKLAPSLLPNIAIPSVQPPSQPVPAALRSANAANNWEPVFLPETREQPTQSSRNSSKTTPLVFVTGVLVGCVIVLGGIAGLRLGRSTARPATPAQIQIPAPQPVTAPAVQTPPPVDGSDLDDARFVSPPENNDAGTAGRDLIDSVPARPEDASRTPAPAVVTSRPRQNPQPKNQDNQADRSKLALLARRMSAPRSQAQQSLVGNGPPPGVTSGDESRAVAAGMPDLVKAPQPPAAPADRTGGFLEAVLIQHDPPVYPSKAMKKHLEGQVKVSANVGIDGVPRTLKLVSGDPELGQAAEEAISRWHYIPAVSGGVPVESRVIIVINFQSQP